jgi:6-phosphogluconolactonase (cycloisomerase 2 family)
MNTSRTVYVGTWSPFIYVLNLNIETGQITLQNTINVGNSPSWITFNPNKTHLYTVNEADEFQNTKNTGGILCFRIDKNNGGLIPIIYSITWLGTLSFNDR